jgi:hypothetical protein
MSLDYASVYFTICLVQKFRQSDIALSSGEPITPCLPMVDLLPLFPIRNKNSYDYSYDYQMILIFRLTSELMLLCVYVYAFEYTIIIPLLIDNM